MLLGGLPSGDIVTSATEINFGLTTAVASEKLHNTHGCFGSVEAAGSECVFEIEVVVGNYTGLRRCRWSVAGKWKEYCHDYSFNCTV